MTQQLMSSTSCYAPFTTSKPLLYGQCVVCLSGTAGDAGNKLAFLTLAQVFPSTLHPSFSSLPFIWPLQGMTTCLCCPPYWGYSDETLIQAPDVGNEVYEFSLQMRPTGSGCGHNDYQSKKCQVYDAERFQVGKTGRVKKKKKKSFIISFCS